MKSPVPWIAVFVCLPSISLMAQNVKVLVLDAVSGKPQSKMEVSFFCQDSMRNHLPPEEDDTDDDGVVIIPYTCKGEESKIVIDASGSVEERGSKEQCGSSGVAATIEEISSKGIISAPDAAGQMHCTTKISRKLKPVPGQVVILVKKPSWWQSHF